MTSTDRISAIDPLALRGWDAQDIRLQALELLQATASSNALFFDLAHAADGTRYHAPLATDDIAEQVSDIAGRHVIADSIVYRAGRGWSVGQPGPQMFNRFSTLEEDYGSLNTAYEFETFQLKYRPMKITDQARALFYNGNRFIGFLAAVRRHGETFSSDSIARIRSQTETFRRLLLLADRAAAGGPTSPLHIIFDETGSVMFADERARSWITARRRDLLQHLLGSGQAAVVDGMIPTWGWLDDGHRKLRHLILSPTRPLRATRWHHLSNAQRQIVRLALDGLSNAEIARVEGISASTVKYHLAQASTTLGVSGRRGLLDALITQD